MYNLFLGFSISYSLTLKSHYMLPTPPPRPHTPKKVTFISSYLIFCHPKFQHEWYYHLLYFGQLYQIIPSTSLVCMKSHLHYQHLWPHQTRSRLLLTNCPAKLSCQESTWSAGNTSWQIISLKQICRLQDLTTAGFSDSPRCNFVSPQAGLPFRNDDYWQLCVPHQIIS